MSKPLNAVWHQIKEDPLRWCNCPVQRLLGRGAVHPVGEGEAGIEHVALASGETTTQGGVGLGVGTGRGTCIHLKLDRLYVHGRLLYR